MTNVIQFPDRRSQLAAEAEAAQQDVSLDGLTEDEIILLALENGIRDTEQRLADGYAAARSRLRVVGAE